MRATFKVLLFIAVFSFQSCQDQDDVLYTNDLQIQKFIWKGLNEYYLWQAEVPNLANNRFANENDLNAFLKNYSEPEDLFSDLLVDSSIDRFSWIVDDYTTLEQSFQGINASNGLDFGLSLAPGSTTNVVGWVRYVVPNSDASNKNIARGTIFYGINGTQLTINNYKTLLSGESYTLNLADVVNNAIVPNGKSVSLTKTKLAENPIYISKVLESGSHKVGYVMYNGFYDDYDKELNQVFGTLKNAGITDLVLDLRYNGGGSIRTAIRLASMITGQFTGKIFAKEKWNAKINAYFEKENSESLNNYFVDKMDGEAINSLKLNKVYILTSEATASASELVINGLKPYIEVVQIGGLTTGKNVGSVTLYDSPTFAKDKINPKHKYAMQPIVLKIINADGYGEYYNGLTPTYELKERVSNLGILGDSSEPLLNGALRIITGSAKISKTSSEGEGVMKYFKDSRSLNKYQNQMYLDEVPEGLRKAIQN